MHNKKKRQKIWVLAKSLTFTKNVFSVHNYMQLLYSICLWLLYVAIAVGVALAAIAVVWLLWKLISGVVWLLWKLISGVALWLGKVIRKIFCCCCKRGRTMKAPGRNIRIYRNVFERSPRNYFRILRSDQRMLLVWNLKRVNPRQIRNNS